MNIVLDKKVIDDLLSKKLNEHTIRKQLSDYVLVQHQLQSKKSGQVGAEVSQENGGHLLKECCETLGWNGGTIHQIKNVLSAARRVKLTHDEAELSGDWDKLKAAIVTLKAVL